jgi:hypothetical protein
MREEISTPDVVALRPFVKFYADLGFVAFPLGGSLASMQLGPFSFLLQEFEAPGSQATS